MAKKPKILAFAGSLRKDSYNKRVVKVAIEGAEKGGAEVTYIKLEDNPLPVYNEDEHKGEGFPENAKKLQKIFGEHDGFLISSPEYNASLPGGMKNVFDFVSRKSEDYEMIEVFKGKAAAIMTASPGSFGGIRCLGHLRGVLSIMLTSVLPTEIAVGGVHKMFEGDSEEMQDEKMKKLLQDLGKSLSDILKQTHGEIEVADNAG
ncbi:MAG: NAD(P)H-dependent oxidoreductase [Acidobacteriota bacterium]|nr:NAD(P)H-dependent oxidoreductase [Acidobacteriota bacterium]